MAFDNPAILAARAAAKIESDRARARIQQESTAKDDAEFKEAKKPKARKVATKPTAFSSKPAEFDRPSRAMTARSISPATSTDPKRPVWMNNSVIDPSFEFNVFDRLGSAVMHPADLIASVIMDRMKIRAPDDLLQHKTNKAGDLPNASDHALKRHLDHTPKGRDDETPGAKAMAALRAIVPNRIKRQLIIDHVSNLLKLTRDACLNTDGLVEELNEHMPWTELLEGIEDHHVEKGETLTEDVPGMLLVFEKLSHDERCEFMAKAEKVRPLHPSLF